MMNFSILQANLERTIAGKQALLEQYSAKLNCPHSLAAMSSGALIAMRATKEFLQINLTELQNILQDINKCLEQQAAEKSMSTN